MNSGRQGSVCEIRSAADSSLTLKVDTPVLEKARFGPDVLFFASCSLDQCLVKSMFIMILKGLEVAQFRRVS